MMLPMPEMMMVMMMMMLMIKLVSMITMGMVMIQLMEALSRELGLGLAMRMRNMRNMRIMRICGICGCGLKISSTYSTYRGKKLVFLKGNKSSSHVLSGGWTVNLVQISEYSLYQILFLDKVFHYNNPTQKKLRDFLGICFKICACSKVQLNLVGVKI